MERSKSHNKLNQRSAFSLELEPSLHLSLAGYGGGTAKKKPGDDIDVSSPGKQKQSERTYLRAPKIRIDPYTFCTVKGEMIFQVPAAVDPVGSN
jgi:hypothetical protein